MKTLREWCEEFNIVILKPFGFDTSEGEDIYDQLFTLEDVNRRLHNSMILSKTDIIYKGEIL